jgi:sigma-B regulation protein RsbU (phosphoserine phosphatase)
LHASLHAYIDGISNLASLVGKLNNVVHSNTEAERYITMFIAVLDPQEGTILYLNAGHCFPFVVRSKQSSMTSLPATGLPVGMFEDVVFEQVTHKLEPGDFLVLYTDGVTEAMNKSFEEYGEMRFQRAMEGHSSQSAGGFLGGIVSDVEKFVAGEPQSDDVTMVVLKRVS